MARFKKGAKAEGRTIVFVDESGLSERPHRCRTWAPRGKTPVLQYHFNWHLLSVIAGITIWNFNFQLFPGTITAPQVVEFLTHLMPSPRTPRSGTPTALAARSWRESRRRPRSRSNILSGLHRAVVPRAFSLLARSGGAKGEFTFTGGVAKNVAVVQFIREMVKRNYGEITLNVHPDSIFMGALGAALFVARDHGAASAGRRAADIPGEPATRSRSWASRSPTSPTSPARARARWSARSAATSTA